jgi:hypothetical protein
MVFCGCLQQGDFLFSPQVGEDRERVMIDQDGVPQTKHSNLEVLQRLRRTSRQVWNRSRWKSAVARFRHLLLLRIGKRDASQDASSISSQ